MKFNKGYKYRIYPNKEQEILINKNRKKPNPDWLDFVKTNIARDKIKYNLNKDKESKILSLLNKKRIK